MPVDLDIIPTPLPPDATALSPLALLQCVAETSSDYVMLHSGPAEITGQSVLAFDPLCKILVDCQGNAALAADASLQALLPSLPRNMPLEALQTAIEAVRFPAAHPLLGWLGFISYDVARFLERIPAVAPDELCWPIISFTLFKRYVIFNGGATTAFTVQRRGQPSSTPDWDAILRPSTAPIGSAAATIIERQSPAAFQAKVARAKEYIAAGDIYQANLAQRWVLETVAKPHDVFARLCVVSPAPYAACMRFRDGHAPRHVVSASPELFLTVGEDQGSREALTRPIKGTRPRDLQDALRDEALREELLASAKDHAELTMIVDLLRNDLGRVAEYGSVRVLDARAIERHPTVWHTAATIEARLRSNAGLAEILAALCPGGSITGAPKIRAMQIIEELEGFRRGMYCGNIGVIGSQGASIALNIAIRTLVMQQGRAYLYAGGGIVADSNPAHEYEETLHKAAAMFAALGCTP